MSLPNGNAACGRVDQDGPPMGSSPLDLKVFLAMAGEGGRESAAGASPSRVEPGEPLLPSGGLTASLRGSG